MKNSVRITGGDLKGKKIPFHFKSSLRPTSSKLREVLFNWIQFEIHNLKCLDLFAGTGSLGIEAISRGAHNTVIIYRYSVVFCEAIYICLRHAFTAFVKHEHDATSAFGETSQNIQLRVRKLITWSAKH